MGALQPAARYDGYGACPLLTDYGKCILAEFLYDGVPHETLPFDQVGSPARGLAGFMERAHTMLRTGAIYFD